MTTLQPVTCACHNIASHRHDVRRRGFLAVPFYPNHGRQAVATQGSDSSILQTTSSLGTTASRPTEASKAAVCYVRFTSTPVVAGATVMLEIRRKAVSICAHRRGPPEILGVVPLGGSK